MPKNYVSLKNTGIDFKNLLSGPAQIGDILNNIILAGQGILKHRPSNRTKILEANFGYAWTLEFMNGIGLVDFEKIENDEKHSEFFVRLTNNGNKIYNILVDNVVAGYLEFKDPKNKEVFEHLRAKNALNVINVLEDVVRESIIFQDLCIFLDIENATSRTIVYPKKEFSNEFYREIYEFYSGEKYVNKGSGASTGENRVPSLFQLLAFIGYAEDRKTTIEFNVDAFRHPIHNSEYVLDTSIEHLISEYEKEEKIVKDIRSEDIITSLGEKYGIQGTRTITTTVRLSQAQLIFKERLKAENGCNCCLCGIHNDELLIGSHIKDAAICNIHEKADNNNGLLLCAMHDKLFDRGLITFNFMDGNIRISKKLDMDELGLCNINSNISLGDQLLTDGRKQYLIWHNHEFYTKNHEFYE